MGILHGLKTLFSTVTLFATQQADKFEPLKPGHGQETLAAGPLVYAAYAAVWLVLLGYLFLLWNRAGRLERQAAALNDRLRRTHDTTM